MRRTTYLGQSIWHTVKRGGEMKGIEVVSMIKINGSWVNQEDLKREELSQILEKKLDETMKNIGFERRKTA